MLEYRLHKETFVIHTVIIVDLLVIIKKRMTSCFIVYWGEGLHINRMCVCV